MRKSVERQHITVVMDSGDFPALERLATGLGFEAELKTDLPSRERGVPANSGVVFAKFIRNGGGPGKKS